MTYHSYRESEPKKPCPYCQELMEADWVDVEVGMVQCGPYHCYHCDASQMGPEKANPGFKDTVTEEEWKTGFYIGRISPLANQVDGKPISHKEAENRYKQGLKYKADQ